MTDIQDLIRPDRGQDSIPSRLVGKAGFDDFARPGRASWHMLKQRFG